MIRNLWDLFRGTAHTAKDQKDTEKDQLCFNAIQILVHCSIIINIYDKEMSPLTVCCCLNVKM